MGAASEFLGSNLLIDEESGKSNSSFRHVSPVSPPPSTGEDVSAPMSQREEDEEFFFSMWQQVHVKVVYMGRRCRASVGAARSPESVAAPPNHPEDSGQVVARLAGFSEEEARRDLKPAEGGQDDFSGSQEIPGQEDGHLNFGGFLNLCGSPTSPIEPVDDSRAGVEVVEDVLSREAGKLPAEDHDPSGGGHGPSGGGQNPRRIPRSSDIVVDLEALEEVNLQSPLQDEGRSQVQTTKLLGATKKSHGESCPAQFFRSPEKMLLGIKAEDHVCWEEGPQARIGEAKERVRNEEVLNRILSPPILGESRSPPSPPLRKKNPPSCQSQTTPYWDDAEVPAKLRAAENISLAEESCSADNRITVQTAAHLIESGGPDLKKKSPTTTGGWRRQTPTLRVSPTTRCCPNEENGGEPIPPPKKSLPHRGLTRQTRGGQRPAYALPSVQSARSTTPVASANDVLKVNPGGLSARKRKDSLLNPYANN